MVVDEDGAVLSARGVGIIEVRGAAVTNGYITAAGFIGAQDDHGWYDTGNLGYLTETGNGVVCGRLKDVIIMGGRCAAGALHGCEQLFLDRHI
jgi:fatty-acyl-CoA synthase